MKKTSLILLSIAMACALLAQTVTTNTTVTVTKSISDSDLINIVAGVNSMNLSPVKVTPDILQSAEVVPAGINYRIGVTVAPIVILTTNISDTGITTVTKRVVTTQIPTAFLNQPQMSAIFDLAIGKVGNMNPPLTINNFSYMILNHDTNGGWTVLARMK